MHYTHFPSSSILSLTSINTTPAVLRHHSSSCCLQELRTESTTMRSAATIAASSFFFIVCFLFLSFASLPLPCASNPSRRILHQPFVPLDTFPPSLPPSPSPPVPPSTTTNTTTTPKFPSSSSAPPGTPFFPTFPSPPPPPSPIAFASFPANISSLILPNSPKPHSNSSKLLAVTAAAVISAVIVVGIIVFYYCRRRFQNRKYVDDDKGYRSSDNNTRRYSTQNAEARSSTAPKLRTNSTSSEFLYLGTLVDSTCINDSSNVAMDPRKLDSPELRPLPPLNKQGSRQNCGNGEVESTTGDEEEFYSPRESLGGRDSSSGAGSRSRRVFADVAGADFGRMSSDSSSCSCSSSSAGSPSRSISISPPVSLSPQPKSPETVAVQSPSPPRPPPPPSFHGEVLSGERSSPSLSMVSSSPDRAHVGNTHASRRQSDASDQNSGSDSLASIRFSKVSNPNVRSPSLSPARIDNEINRNIQSLSLSSASTSPDRSWAASPRMSNVFNPNVRSPSLSSASTSPDRCLEKKLVATPRLSNNSLPSTSSSSSSSSPEPVLKKSPALNVKIRSALELPNSVVTPPPPPPPPPPPQRPWESPVEPTPTGQPISKPPSLIPPSRPFVLQSTTKISPVELPPSSKAMENVEETPKPKLKPLHWDKVRASSDREMVWDQLRSSSFKLNEEMIETLFVNKPTPKPKQTTPGSVLPSPNQENRVLDPKKSQNIAILLRAINVTVEEVCDALLEGNADMLGSELLESLLKMAPTKEEERKLKEYKEDSPTKIGPAEKFLKALLDIPFAFRRVDAMLYIANFESEIEYLKKSFETLEAACEELRSSRMFLKLLEAVLKTGNRMNVGTNRGDAQAFKLDTLHKLVDVKGADGKTTLLHFVVQEIIRTEGARLSGTNPTPSSTLSEDAKCRKLGLQVVSGLSSELTNVKKAAAMDSDVLSSEVCKLSRGVENINQVVQLNRTIGSDESTKKFLDSMSRFMKMAEEEIIRIQAQESVAMSLVKEITEYFHGNSAKEEAHPFRIFTVVRDFLTILDRVCKEVGMINERTIVSSAHKFPVPVNPMMPQVFPVNPTLPQAFPGYHVRQQQYNSSDDEGASA